MNLKELRGRLNVVATEMSTLAQKNDRTEEDDTKLDALLAEFNDLGPQVERLTAIDAAAGRARELGQSAGRVAGAESLASDDADDKGTGGRQIARRQSPGETFAQSQAVKDFIAGGFKGSSAKVKIGGDEKASATYDGDGPLNRYTLIDSADLPGFMVPPQVVSEIKRPRDYALTARDVLINARTTSDTIYYLRELVFTNSASETAQGTSIPEPASALLVIWIACFANRRRG